jgi:cell division protein FtsW (lipid II flippase)
LLLAFGTLSLAAIAIGAEVGAAHGESPAAWARNLAAWLVGALMAAAIVGVRKVDWAPLLLWAAPLGLLACYFSPGQQGVHRWIDLGPAHINVAMLLLPAMTVALAALARDRIGPWIGALAAAMVLLAAQPDASQAAALACAAAVTVIGLVRRPAIRLATLAGLLGLAVVAWLRPDPLQPVAEVEGIIGLAFSLSPLLAGLALLCLAGTAAAPAVLTWSSPLPARLAGRALAACFLVWAAAPFLGAFPVPFAGIGPSSVLGGWLGVGLLAALTKGGEAA